MPVQQQMEWRDKVMRYLLVYIHLQSRRVRVSPTTFRLTRRWTAEQAIVFHRQHVNSGSAPSIVLHDRDTKFPWSSSP